MKIKKTAITIGICMAILGTTAVSAFAISNIVKQKNPYQLAAEQGISISEVDKEENFKYTEFDSATKIDSINDDSKVINNENFSDVKTNIYKKMLNTIDNFNEIELTLETSMLSNEKTTVTYQTNIDEGYAYESVVENGVLVKETYAKPNDVYLTFVDNNARTYNRQYLGSYKRSDTPYIPLAERTYTEDDGIPCYVYRRNITNCPLASYSIVPQEITFSYLKDFDKWNINANVEYLGRKCVEIKGKTTPYVSEKQNCDIFTMIVDSETGVLMKFEGFKNGKLTDYITVTECVFGKTRNAIKQFDVNQYSSYEEVFR